MSKTDNENAIYKMIYQIFHYINLLQIRRIISHISEDRNTETDKDVVSIKHTTKNLKKIRHNIMPTNL